LSFSPAQDLLATTHVERRGVYVWANQLVFGSSADILTSEKPIRAKLPGLQAGFPGQNDAEDVEMNVGEQAAKLEASLLQHTKGRRNGNGESTSDRETESESSAVVVSGGGFKAEESDSFYESDEDDESSRRWLDGSGATSGTSLQVDLANAEYVAKDSSGAPVPLVPHLITMSMLPRTQWLNLVHLETIKERNKPIEPPSKPDAAPFFLPTLSHANAGRDVIFDDLKNGEGEGEGDKGDKIMVLGSSDFGAGGKLVGGESRFIKLLRQCSSAGDWTSLIALLRDMSPVEIDQEIRSLQPTVFAADDDILLFLQFIESETASSTNFEFIQAILSSTVSILGEIIAENPILRQAAARIEQRVNASWKRLDSTLQHVRCMIGLLGGLQ
jgi:hypothetical protein